MVAVLYRACLTVSKAHHNRPTTLDPRAAQMIATQCLSLSTFEVNITLTSNLIFSTNERKTVQRHSICLPEEHD